MFTLDFLVLKEIQNEWGQLGQGRESYENILIANIYIDIYIFIYKMVPPCRIIQNVFGLFYLPIYNAELPSIDK